MTLIDAADINVTHMDEAPHDLLTAPEVAEMFRVTVSTVARWARDGDLEGIKTPGGRGQLRFRRIDVEALLGRVAGTSKDVA